MHVIWMKNSSSCATAAHTHTRTKHSVSTRRCCMCDHLNAKSATLTIKVLEVKYNIHLDGYCFSFWSLCLTRSQHSCLSTLAYSYFVHSNLHNAKTTTINYCSPVHSVWGQKTIRSIVIKWLTVRVYKFYFIWRAKILGPRTKNEDMHLILLLFRRRTHVTHVYDALPFAYMYNT